MFIAQPPINKVIIEAFPSSNFYTRPNGTAAFCSKFVARKCTLEDDQGIKMGRLNDYIQSTAVPGLRKPVFVRLVPQGHFPGLCIAETVRYKFWYEVRDGKVSRQTQPSYLLVGS